MSLLQNNVNSLETDDKKSTDRENSIAINRLHLNPIKIKKHFDNHYSKNRTIDINNENPLLLKNDKKLINTNKLLNYLNNINTKKEYIYKDLSLKSRNF